MSTAIPVSTAAPKGVPDSGFVGWIESRPQAAFGGFLALHFIVWTALPSLLYANLPLDLIEALTYGREWQLGSDKLPPLPWWMVEIIYRLFGTDAAYYALAQATVIIAFALVFATARPLVGSTGALVAVAHHRRHALFPLHGGEIQSRRYSVAVLGARRLCLSCRA